MRRTSKKTANAGGKHQTRTEAVRFGASALRAHLSIYSVHQIFVKMNNAGNNPAGG
jgi:hypothetical protein